MKKNDFLKYCDKNKISYEIVKAKWPYNYGNNKGYQATNKNGVLVYFFFNDDGILLQRRIIKKDR